ncbi:MAG: tetratricopeptide repeat protein [Alphaproteobacteria bacterium]|nr:tetratricopeptide repeat protein [Alphaproteobacteria bacterium]
MRVSKLLLVLLLLTALARPAFADGFKAYQAGRAALDAGRLQDAIRFTTTAIESGELDERALSIAYNARGLAFRRIGRLDAAVADYDRAIGVRPDYAMAFNNRGIANQSRGAYADAIYDHSQAIALDPAYVNAYVGRCLAYEARKQKELAASDCRKALELDPDKEGAKKALKRMGAGPW